MGECFMCRSISANLLDLRYTTCVSQNVKPIRLLCDRLVANLNIWRWLWHVCACCFCQFHWHHKCNKFHHVNMFGNCPVTFITHDNNLRLSSLVEVSNISIVLWMTILCLQNYKLSASEQWKLIMYSYIYLLNENKK